MRAAFECERRKSHEITGRRTRCPQVQGRDILLSCCCAPIASAPHSIEPPQAGIEPGGVREPGRVGQKDKDRSSIEARELTTGDDDSHPECEDVDECEIELVEWGPVRREKGAT